MAVSKQQSSRALIGLAFFGFILIGAVGGAGGILLPSQIIYYHVDNAVIGLLFFAFSAGYFLAASGAGLLTQKLGQRGYLIGGAATFLLGTLTFGLRPPFLLVLATNLLLGFGAASIDAGFNAAVAALPRSTKLLNYLHAFYGIGALLGPLVASAFLAIHWEWNAVYLVWCVLSLPLLIGSALLLRPRLLDSASQQAEQHVPGNVAVAALKLGAVWLGALFLFLYVGAEVSVGNWGYSFLFYDRHLTALLAAWVMSAYWLSLTLGRFLLSTIANQLHLSITGTISSCLVGIGIGVALAWLLPVAPTAILGFCLIGFFMGPIFPTTISVMPQLVAARLVPSAIGFLVGASVVGGALFPWLVGTLAQYLSFWVLLPYTFALIAAMYPNWSVMTRRYAPSHG